MHAIDTSFCNVWSDYLRAIEYTVSLIRLWLSLSAELLTTKYNFVIVSDHSSHMETLNTRFYPEPPIKTWLNKGLRMSYICKCESFTHNFCSQHLSEFFNKMFIIYWNMYLSIRSICVLVSYVHTHAFQQNMVLVTNNILFWLTQSGLDLKWSWIIIQTVTGSVQKSYHVNKRHGQTVVQDTLIHTSIRVLLSPGSHLLVSVMPLSVLFLLWTLVVNRLPLVKMRVVTVKRIRKRSSVFTCKQCGMLRQVVFVKWTLVK